MHFLIDLVAAVLLSGARAAPTPRYNRFDRTSLTRRADINSVSLHQTCTGTVECMENLVCEPVLKTCMIGTNNACTYHWDCATGNCWMNGFSSGFCKPSTYPPHDISAEALRKEYTKCEKTMQGRKRKDNVIGRTGKPRGLQRVEDEKAANALPYARSGPNHLRTSTGARSSRPKAPRQPPQDIPQPYAHSVPYIPQPHHMQPGPNSQMHTYPAQDPRFANQAGPSHMNLYIPPGVRNPSPPMNLYIPDGVRNPPPPLMRPDIPEASRLGMPTNTAANAVAPPADVEYNAQKRM